MGKIFFILVILLILIPIKQTFAHSQIQIIEISENGFKPESVTVDENTTIIFVNNDSKQRWPASNVHPTHDLYPEFDPKKPIEIGQSWPFKPKKIGTWKYHDHLFPHQRGTIIVTKEKKVMASKSKSTNLVDMKNNVSKFLENLLSFLTPKKLVKEIKLPDKKNFGGLTFEKQTEVISTLAKQSPKKVWPWFKQVFTDQAGSSGNIHDLAHFAGNALYKNMGFKGLGLCGSEFAFGCYHGFLDEAFSKSLDSLPETQQACLELDSKNNTVSQVSGPAASCIHGIGHGIASYFATKDLKSSLATCRKMAVGSDYCFDGVFMELVRNAPPSFFHKDDPLYPCNMLEKEYGYTYSYTCGRNQPSLLMNRFSMSFDEIIKTCLDSDSKPFKQSCFEALGFSLAAEQNVDTVVGGCQKIAVLEFTRSCLKAAAGEMVFQEVPNWWSKAQRICDSDEQFRAECLEHVERIITEYGRKRQINFTNIEKKEDVNSYIRKQLASCYEIGGRDGCYQQAAKVLHNQFGLSKTLELLKNNESYTEVFARCHEVTHYLSRFEYEKQKNIAKVYAQCNSSCHGGCYHGTLEAYLKEEESKIGSDITRIFSKVCRNENDYKKPIEFYECLHGLGHAAMFVTDMELLQSLKLCDKLLKPINKEKCYTGVFMENSSSSTSFDHKSKYVKSDDPFYPCNSIDEKYQQICWQYQSSYFSIINNQDWAKVADMCLKIPHEYQDRCFRTIGTNQVGFTKSLETMKQDCSLMPSLHFENICIGGVIVSLSYRFVGDVEKMAEFCSLVNLDYKEGCFKQIGTSILDWSADTGLLIKECEKIADPQGIYWCINEVKSV